MTAPPRKVPRIISRGTPRLAKYASDKNSDVGEPTPSDDSVRAEDDLLSQELRDEQLVVRDGVVVAVHQSSKTVTSGKRIVIEDGISKVANEPYTQNPLPGIADEIESYPCKFCLDKVFLTSFGLERHARQVHRDRMTEIQLQISTISSEWRRREEERGRQRERAHIARLRQEAIAQQAVRQATLGTLGAATTDLNSTSTDTALDTIERYEACRICSLLVNALHPTAMESHLRAHKKNDELRSQLLAEYGPEIVSRLTCHDCHLVFTDEKKLMIHTENMHVRRRKFICKWCGHVCPSVAELNIHKADVHAMPAYSQRHERIMRNKLDSRHRNSAALGAPSKKNEMQSRHGHHIVNNDNMPCRTVCDECGLRLVRPSLLIRHMLRVHSKEAFSCHVETSGMPPFKIDVDRGRILWTCCDVSYTDRTDFLHHRRQEHLEKLTSIFMNDDHQIRMDRQTNTERLLNLANINLPEGESSMTTYTGELVSAPDGTMQVIVPEGVNVDGGEIYVMLVDENGIEAKDGHSNLLPVEMEMITEDGEQQPETSQPDDDIIAQAAAAAMNEGGDAVTISEEQYERLRMEYGDQLNNMVMAITQIVFVNEADIGENSIMIEGESEEGVHESERRTEEEIFAQIPIEEE
uniref:C2H2-type domain-containing protein n=1 Tax=Heterorhabditis bacteriophora TaxID=37862 RepID=A0A1I7X9X7_HETBA